MIYLSNNEKHIFLINYKCMFSTFQSGFLADNKVTLLKEQCTRITRLKRMLSFWRKNKYIIVRNPYERLKSFYVDKFVRNIGNFNQTCQKNMLKYVSEDKIKTQGLSFDDFIKAMKAGYNDGHIKPQFLLYEAYKRTYFTNKINIIRLENQQEMDNLKAIFEVNKIPNFNSDKKNLKREIILDDATRKFIFERYKKDFELFSYSFDPKIKEPC